VNLWLTFQVAFHVFHHRSDGMHRLTELFGGYIELLAPITELVVLVDVDAAIVSRSGLGQVIWHGAGQLIWLQLTPHSPNTDDAEVRLPEPMACLSHASRQSREGRL
jgi:hypothetical protein